MDIQKLCNNYFQMIRHPLENKSSMGRALTAAAILSCFTLVIPAGFAAVYGFANLIGRIKKFEKPSNITSLANEAINPTPEKTAEKPVLSKLEQLAQDTDLPIDLLNFLNDYNPKNNFCQNAANSLKEKLLPSKTVKSVDFHRLKNIIVISYHDKEPLILLSEILMGGGVMINPAIVTHIENSNKRINFLIFAPRLESTRNLTLTSPKGTKHDYFTLPYDPSKQSVVLSEDLISQLS